MAIKTQKLGSIRDLYDTSKAYNSKLSFRIRLTKVITPANNSYAFDKQGGKKMRTQQPSMPLKLMEEVTYTYPSDYKDKDLRGTTQSRIMRHCKNETSIWMDEQRPETEVKHKVTELLITDGYLDIPARDVSILEAIKVSNRNGSNPNRDTRVKIKYVIEDRGAAIDKLIAADLKITEVKAAIINPEYEIMVIAYMRIVMGESQFTKVFDGGSERGKREIIWRAGKIAEKNPDAFDKGMRDESTINKHYILTGIDQTYLTLDEMYNTIRITSNNMLLQQAPKGVNVVDLFIDNVKRGESKSLMQLALKEMKVIKESESVVVTGVKAGEKAPTPKEVKEIGGKPESDFISGVTKQEAISLMEGAIEAQPPILTLSPPSHYHYKKGTDEQKYFLGKSKILDALASDPAFVVVLQDAVHKAALNPA